MIDPQTRFEELIDALKKREYRLTPQRMELIRLIAASEGHPSAAQLFSTIKQRFPTMSHATVYKTLALLKEMGQILEIDFRDDRHYDGNRPTPHPHLICIRCNKIIDGDLELDPQSMIKLEQSSGYRIIRSQIIIYGLCPECQKYLQSNF